MTDSAPSPSPPVAQDTLAIVETVLLCAGRKLRFSELLDAFWGTMQSQELIGLLEAIPELWKNKGFELAHSGELWWVRAKPDVQAAINRAEAESSSSGHRASKATLETLAVIAYTQPCTKGDIEERRGLSVSPSVLEQLVERGWIEVIGHRNAPQAPALYATTNKFLDDLGLYTLEDLPSLDSALGTAEPQAEPEEPDPDAYVPYDGPMPLLPGETAPEQGAAVASPPAADTAQVEANTVERPAT